MTPGTNAPAQLQEHNTASSPKTSPWAAVGSFLENRRLITEMVKRDFTSRYKGSVLGIAWSLLSPLVLLVLYTFVFSVALNAKWGVGVESKSSFAIVLFSGMMVHALLAECIGRAPTLILAHSNFVKKVVFPLEILPVVVLASALLHFGVSLLILVAASATLGGGITAKILLAPVAVLPLVLFSLGVSWVLASLGVYLRDLTQGMGIFVTLLLFVSPVFYPLDALPREYRWIVELNPITMPIQQLRNVVLWDRGIEWDAWLVGVAIGALAFCIGFWWFQRSRKGFADVI